MVVTCRAAVLALVTLGVKRLALVKDKYRWNPLINENRDATLGLVGGAGFPYK